MKRIIPYLLPLCFVLVLTAGCVKQQDNPPVVLPAGNFSGTYLQIHLNPTTGKKDTTQGNLNIAMSSTTGYAVTGDTSKHAASHGSYAVDGVNIQFIDQTLPSIITKPPAKIHLAGIYQYGYNSPNLQIVFQNDTLAILYNMTAH